MRLIQKMFVMARFGILSTAVLCMTAGSFCAYGGDVIGKVVTGYQGWLSAPNDGSLVNKWKHTNLECWPDVREYTTTFSGCTFYQAGVLQSAYYGNLGNGEPAKMFSNWSDQTVNKHFEWMKQYEIDCAALQRFGCELGDPAMKAYKDGIANKVKTAAQTYGRKYYIMYDITAWTSFQSEIKTDWLNSMKLHTNSSAYAMENGKPVVCVWGIGFDTGNVTSWTDVVNWFKGQGCYVIGGVKGTFATDTVNKTAYKACNMVMAWRVGSTRDPNTVFAADLAWCNSNGLAYQGDIYPGTSFYNTDPSRPKNRIPRYHGDFMWKQFAAARLKGVQSVYISMFDEVQEATQIFKTAENSSMIPAGKYFLTLNADGVACSSDFYLRLTQDGGKMIKKITGYVTNHPTFHDLTNNASYITQTGVPVTMTTGQTVNVTVSMKNTGTTIWSPAEAQKLGSLNDTTNWGFSRVFLTNSVAPNQTNIFTFAIKAPSVPGNYAFQWRMVDDAGSNIGWFGTTSVLKTITVTSGTTTTTVPWVTNLTQAVAGTTITNAGLVVSSVNAEYHATVPVGNIFSQTPAGGTTVALGSSVALAVSLGPTPTTGTTVTFTSVAAHDGYVDESSETSNVGGAMSATLTTGTALRVGDTGARKQRKTFVSFNTASLPDTAVVTKAILKLKRGGILGTPTTLGAITVDIKNTSIGFGTTEALEIIDFQAAASKSNVGTLSYPTANDTWATATLNADGISRINKTDHTQFRVRFVTDDDNDSADDYLGFYSGENATAANRPVLEVTYQ